MTPIRLIAADMDGTPAGFPKRLPAGIFPMIRELTGRGYPVRHRERAPIL